MMQEGERRERGGYKRRGEVEERRRMNEKGRYIDMGELEEEEDRLI